MAYVQAELRKMASELDTAKAGMRQAKEQSRETQREVRAAQSALQQAQDKHAAETEVLQVGHLWCLCVGWLPDSHRITFA
jgi:predicted  nucleic acid-binding Zn-ribbon protein